jgi:hypothetical protein
MVAFCLVARLTPTSWAALLALHQLVPVDRHTEERGCRENILSRQAPLPVWMVLASQVMAPQLIAKSCMANAQQVGRILSGPEIMDVHVHEIILIKTNTTEL